MLGRVPSGELIDSARHEPKLRTAEVIHSDMSWRRVSVLAWAVHRNGWAVLIRWPDGREDWRGYDRRYIRPALSLVVGGSGQLDRSRRHAGACSVRTGARVVSAVGTAGGPSGSRWGSSRSSQGGIHQLRRPSRNMVAGTMTSRMTDASMSPRAPAGRHADQPGILNTPDPAYRELHAASPSRRWLGYRPALRGIGTRETGTRDSGKGWASSRTRRLSTRRPRRSRTRSQLRLTSG
jgi:hypothetical protein